MLKQAVDFGKQVFALTRDTQQNKEDIKALREEVREVRREIVEIRQSVGDMRQEINQQRLDFADLTRLVEKLIIELHHQQENAAKDREMQELRLQNIVLRQERGLPPGSPPTKKPKP